MVAVVALAWRGRPGAGGADQVVGEGGQGEPGGVGVEMSGRRVGEGAVVEVGDDLLDDRVAAVLLLGLEGLERGVGEDGVVAPGGEQLALARRRVGSCRGRGGR